MPKEPRDQEGLVFRKKAAARDSGPPAVTPLSITIDLMLIAAIAYIVLAGILKII